MEGYTGIVPYVCSVLHRARCRLGFRRLRTEEPPAPLNRRFRIAGFVIVVSRMWRKSLQGMRIKM
ncbi:hypothetical protein Acr_00g0047520 [Actinidia rufa]|uniref:Uncharacterized protein n=1 Tax=Actinidia rufa TaxID=165716 RepID=A0A7J0DLA4_9ERIC|nr:hypothetical protein Acr_00g0047520 [Actinidia rufa]